MASRDWAVVTGASSGIGRAFADLLAGDGVNLVLMARDGTMLMKLARRLEKTYGIRTIVFAGDLTDMAIIHKLVEAVDHAKIRVTYLVNSAGAGDYGAFLTTDWKREYAMIELNMAALTYLTKHFAFEMKQDGRGYIVNLASVAAFWPGPNMSVYHASKAYVLHFSEALAEELRGTGVTVTALCPGPTASGFAKAARATRAGIFKRTLPKAAAVASYGYRAMLKGRRVAVYGVRNKLLVFGARFVPRSLITRFTTIRQG